VPVALEKIITLGYYLLGKKQSSWRGAHIISYNPLGLFIPQPLVDMMGGIRLRKAGLDLLSFEYITPSQRSLLF
jgi:hypothetical protein